MSSPDQRKHQRLTLRVPAKIYPKGDPSKVVLAELLDMSTGGAFVHCLAPIQLGEEIVLKIDFFETCSIEGEVVEIGKLPSDNSAPKVEEKSIVRWARGSSQNGFGIEFLDLSPEKKQYLERLIKHLQSLSDSSKNQKKKKRA